MLARANKVFHEHVLKDVTDKTKTSCCVGKNSSKAEKAIKESLLINNQNNRWYPNLSNEPIHYVLDSISGTVYARGKLLGKGGFAKCYEMIDLKSSKTYAGKIISKSRLLKPHQKEKIVREIELHRKLKHSHVVGFHSYFEDDDNVYIILENCCRKSLAHILKCRKTLTEPEVRYYLRHLIEACRYIHSQRIIHRDLKLGNMLLNDSMQLKIADFGLATKVAFEGEKKTTVCGTPNYIAPEVLQKKGHSYEADTWAIGCTMYAMLVGRPPFETNTLKETYMRITANKYYVPSNISPSARNLIQKLLAPQPNHRPSFDKILMDDFFISHFTPKTLPTSCCDTQPKFNIPNTTTSRPKSYAAPVSPAEAMQRITSSLAQMKGSKRSASQILTKTSSAKDETAISDGRTCTPSRIENDYAPRRPRPASLAEPKTSTSSVTESSPRGCASQAELKSLPFGSAVRMYQLLTTCLDQMPADSCPSPAHNVKPLWVTKWVDYSNKYGFGFQLSDKSVGVLFNDTTRMLLAPNGKTTQFNDLSNKVYTFTTDTTPAEYQKKATLLLYFAQYMDEHLIHGGDMLKKDASAEPTGIFMKKWFRTSRAIVLYLNNGSLQVNFFEDHTKVILTPDGQDFLVTFVNTHRQAVSYRLLQFRHFGCHPTIAERLRYAKKMLESIINIEGEAV